MNICFTGHRPNKLWGYNIHHNKYRDLFKILYLTVVNSVAGEREVKLISGMALGVDTVAAYVAIVMKGKGLPVTLEAAVPCKGQERLWPQESQDRYHDILKQADIVTVLEEKYSAAAMQCRNEYMVDNSDLVIAIWDGTPGGTSNCVRYARSKNKQIIIINPKDI